NGCSFLNTPQVTLTTGSIDFRDGAGAPVAFEAAQAIRLNVGGGHIDIAGAGLVSPLARLDLVAQTLKIDGPVTVSGALNLLAGRQSVDADTLAILAPGAGNDQATIGGQWSIDATAFGAMNAGSIKIVSTPAGLGVRSAAHLAASSGDLILSANGDLTIKGGHAGRDVAVSSSATVTNTATLQADRNLSLTANTLVNTDQLLYAAGNASLNLTTLANTGGALAAGGLLSLTLPGSLDLAAASTGRLVGDGGLAVQADTLTNSGSFSHGADLTLTANTLTNTGSLTTQGKLTATVGALANSGTLGAHGNAEITATILTNSASGVLVSDADLTLAAPTLSNAGEITALGKLVLASSAFTNSGTIQAQTDADLTLAGTANNAGGRISAGQNLSLTALAVTGALGGQVAAGNDLTLALGDYTHGAGETDFAAGRDMIVSANSLTSAGDLAAWRDLRITTTGNLTNTGTVLAGRDMSLHVGAALANSGIIEAAQDLALTAASVTNSGATSNPSIPPGSLANYRDAVLGAIDDPVIQGKLFNEITPDSQWTNNRVYLYNRWSFYLDSDLPGPVFYLTISRHTAGGSLAAGRNLNATVSGAFSNSAALVTAGNNLMLQA
ncbi:hypothetical protein EG831_07760, partial [bacterium]|nr:hypothetical protein [bacterium]